MRVFILFFILSFFLKSCTSFDQQKDILNTTFEEDLLKEDLSLLKGIITEAHAGIYLYNTPEQVDALFDSVLQSVNKPLTLREFYNKVDLIIDRVHCIHTLSYLPEEYYDSIYKRAVFFPIPLIVIDNKIYVNSNTFSVPLGSEVIALNENPALNLIRALGVYTHTDGFSNSLKNNAINNDFAINYFLAYGPDKEFRLMYFDSAGKKTETVHVEAESLKQINKSVYDDTWYFLPNDAPYDFEILDNETTAIMTLRSFSFSTHATSSAFAHFIDNSFRLIRENHINNLVIDCRNNGGGEYSNSYPLLTYLIDRPIKEYDSSIRRFDSLPFPELLSPDDIVNGKNEDSTANDFIQIRPEVYKEKDEKVNTWNPGDFVFKGKLFVITNPYVVSAASNFVSILRDQKRAVIVGEETAGNNAVHSSYPFLYTLPNSKIEVKIPTRRYYQPVVKTNNGHGVQPDKYIPLNPRDFIDYKDRPLIYVLDSLITKNK